MKEIKVVELFAGVGGFRLGLEKASKRFKTIWANQWEPSTKVQHAFEIYNRNFKNSENVNRNISEVVNDVPEHDLLVGGFPCQDYSVAQGNKAKGIQGKKGVLWWEIQKIVQKRKPKMILLENVDRLLKSPSKQRGRDFAIMLRALNDLGYIVEWKAITASDFGFYQKRRRVFILARKMTTRKKPINFFESEAILNKAFRELDIKKKKHDNISRDMYSDLIEITDKYGDGSFYSTGISINGVVYSVDYKKNDNKSKYHFKDILDMSERGYVFLTEEQIEKAKKLKYGKNVMRTTKNQFTYNYIEGKMSFPDKLDKPGRTMLTSEGTINRSSHFIEHKGKIRFMTPIEAERLNGFPDNWTLGKTDRQRFFFMGNALVVGIVTRIGKYIKEEFNE